jgi:hypothetical protein
MRLNCAGDKGKDANGDQGRRRHEFMMSGAAVVSGRRVLDVNLRSWLNTGRIRVLHMHLQTDNVCLRHLNFPARYVMLVWGGELRTPNHSHREEEKSKQKLGL